VAVGFGVVVGMSSEKVRRDRISEVLLVVAFLLGVAGWAMVVLER
jgi:hypothetical protein